MIKNYLFNTHPTIIHSPGNNGFFKDIVLEFRNTRQRNKKTPVEDCEVFTWNNRGRPGVLEKSLEKLGCPYTVMGGKIAKSLWKNIFKVYLTVRFLKTVKTKYVMGIDSFDAIFTKHPNHALELFKEFKKPLIFNATTAPNLTITKQMRDWEKTLYPNQLNGFLNAGAWIAETQYAREFFQKVLEKSRHRKKTINKHAKKGTLIQPPNRHPNFLKNPLLKNRYIQFLSQSEQLIVKWVFKETYPTVNIDTKQKIMACLNMPEYYPVKLRQDFGLKILKQNKIRFF